MSPLDEIKATALQMQIIQLETRIEEMSLEHDPDVDSIRNLRKNLEALRLEFAKISADEIVYGPV